MTGNNEQIRVGFVLHVMQVAGAEMLVAEIIRRLASRIDPVVICLDAIGPLGEQLRVEGVEVLDVARRPGLDLRAPGRLAAIARRRRLEVLHAHQYTPFFYAALASLLVRPRPRVILTEHGRHYPDIVSAKRRLANRLVLARLADRITGVCSFSNNGLHEQDGFPLGRMQVIENGIDLARYQSPRDRTALRRGLSLLPNRRYVATIARFHPVKDHATLLKAFATVAAAVPDVDLLLVGDGPLRPQLESNARDLGVSARVLFWGVRNDVADILAAADVFVLPSLSEAASITLLEAMASGLPVVATNVGGNPEMVRDGIDGLLTPRGDAPAMAKSILAVLNDPARAASLGASARERVRERYQLDRTVDRYFDLYCDVARSASVRKD